MTIAGKRKKNKNHFISLIMTEGRGRLMGCQHQRFTCAGLLPKHLEENVTNHFMNFEWALQNAVWAASSSSSSVASWHPLCDQGFFEFTLKTAVHSFILCHLLKPVFCSAVQLVAVSQHFLASQTASSFTLTHSKALPLCIFTLITIPVLPSVSVDMSNPVKSA